MTRYFKIGHDSFFWRGTPWGKGVAYGVCYDSCTACERQIPRYADDRRIGITLDPRKGTFWPDVIGSAFSFCIWSERAVSAWNSQGWPSLPLGDIEIVGNIPAKLRKVPSGRYFWIDGAQLFRAKLNYERSGFVNAEECSVCGGVNYDVSATYDRQRTSPRPRYTFEVLPADAGHLFTATMSPHMFFCTGALVDLARQFELTNFRFIAFEYGVAYAGKDLRYLAGNMTR